MAAAAPALPAAPAPVKPAWEYNLASRRYRNTATGRFLSNEQMVWLRDTFTDRQRAWTAELAKGLADGSKTVQEFELAARRQLKTTFVDQYILGRGGRRQMEPADWGRIGRTLRDQYGYLHGFAGEIAAGTLSPAQIAARADLYVDAGTQSYEQGRAAAHGVARLPAYPGDGSTSCKTRCRCHWSFMTGGPDGQVAATWVRTVSESCQGCVDNAARWSPLLVDRHGNEIG